VSSNPTVPVNTKRGTRLLLKVTLTNPLKYVLKREFLKTGIEKILTLELGGLLKNEHNPN
jgi:hypothetical protein